ncbi:MAG: carbon-nitrogen family hydrolase [Anaerolineae bacterium]|nr:carbon-nitrogen family hydrolase [Anaerolineae bacterium]
MAELIVSMAQMDVKLGNPRINWGKMQQMTTVAKAQGGQLVVFPELWDVGFALEQAKEFASSLSGGLFAQVAALSKQQGIFITGSMLEKRGLGITNSAPMVSPINGLMGAYRKIHLFPLLREDLYLTAGEATFTANLPWGVTSIAICYDLRFPELFRRYALEGAQVVVVPCQWPAERIGHFKTLLRARAIENGMYIVAVNRVGEDVLEEGEAPRRYSGHSMIVDPFGEVVLQAGNVEGVFTAQIDLSTADRARAAIPVLEGRRPDLYGSY